MPFENTTVGLDIVPVYDTPLTLSQRLTFDAEYVRYEKTDSDGDTLYASGAVMHLDPANPGLDVQRLMSEPGKDIPTVMTAGDKLDQFVTQPPCAAVQINLRP